MAWVRKTYLQLVIKWKVEINMTNYPSNRIIPPRLADKDHASQVVKGWKNGTIKWVEISDSDIEVHKRELAEIVNNAAAAKRKTVAEGNELDGQEGNPPS